MITKTMKLSDIKISDAFARTHVSERKLQKCRNYFEKFGKPDREIVVASDEILTDGYIMYLIYKENNIEEIEVKVEDWGASSYRNERTMYIYGRHINGNDVDHKTYMWRVPSNWMRFRDNVQIGDVILCKTRYGIGIVSVTDKKIYDKCPVNFRVKKVASKTIFKKKVAMEGEIYYGGAEEF